MNVASPAPGFSMWGTPVKSPEVNKLKLPIKSMKLDALKISENTAMREILEGHEESVVHYSLVVTEEASGGMDVNRIFVITDATIYKFPKLALQTGISFEAVFPLINLTQLIVLEGSQQPFRVQFRGLKPATGERQLFTIRFNDETKMKECILLLCHLRPNLPIMKKKTIEGRQFDMSYIDPQLTKTRTPPTSTPQTAIDRVSLPLTLKEELQKRRQQEGDHQYLIGNFDSTNTSKGDTRLAKSGNDMESVHREGNVFIEHDCNPLSTIAETTTQHYDGKPAGAHIGPYAAGSNKHTKLMNILDKYVSNAMSDGPPGESEDIIVIPPNTLPHHGYNPPPGSKPYRRYLDGTARLIGKTLEEVQEVGPHGLSGANFKGKYNEKKSVGLPADRSAERKEVTEMLMAREAMQTHYIKESIDDKNKKSAAVSFRQQQATSEGRYERRRTLQDMLANMKYEHGLNEYVQEQQHKNHSNNIRRTVDTRRIELVSKEHKQAARRARRTQIKEDSLRQLPSIVKTPKSQTQSIPLPMIENEIIEVLSFPPESVPSPSPDEETNQIIGVPEDYSSCTDASDTGHMYRIPTEEELAYHERLAGLS